jgi:hypothetical protein
LKPSSGNRCRHNPRAWRVTLNRPFRPNQPLVLHLAAEAFTRELREHPERWPELAEAQQKLFGRANRFRRSEAREAIALVIRACLTRTDVTTRRVGWARRGRRDFQGLRRKTIANWTERHESSVARAFEIVRYAGIMSGPGRKGPNIVPQPVERCDDSHDHRKHCPGRVERIRPDGVRVRGCHGMPAVRQIARWFFDRLGLGDMLEKAIEHAAAAAAAPPAPVLELHRPPPPARSVVKLVAALAAKKAVAPPDTG